MDRAGVDTIFHSSDVSWLGQLMEEPVKVKWLESMGKNGPQCDPYRAVALGLGRLARKSVNDSSLELFWSHT